MVASGFSLANINLQRVITMNLRINTTSFKKRINSTSFVQLCNYFQKHLSGRDIFLVVSEILSHVSTK